MHFRCAGIFNETSLQIFIKCDSEWMLKTGQYLRNLLRKLGRVLVLTFLYINHRLCTTYSHQSSYSHGHTYTSCNIMNTNITTWPMSNSSSVLQCFLAFSFLLPESQFCWKPFVTQGSASDVNVQTLVFTTRCMWFLCSIAIVNHPPVRLWRWGTVGCGHIGWISVQK